MPIDAPSPVGRLAEKSASRASDADFRQYVAAMFVLNYLHIKPDQIRKAAGIARESGNSRFADIANNVLHGLKRVTALLDDAEMRLASTLGRRQSNFVRFCDSWRVNRASNTVRINSTQVITLKPSQSTPQQRKRYWALWTLSHRDAIANKLLQPVRECARDAPLAPATYYTVLQKTNKIDFMRTFEKMMKNAYHISKLAARADRKSMGAVGSIGVAAAAGFGSGTSSTRARLR